MDSKEFYYKIPEDNRGKVVYLPKHPELESYENHNVRLCVPRDASYLMLTQIGLFDSTMAYFDKDMHFATGNGLNLGPYMFIGALEKRLGLIFEKMDNLPKEQQKGKKN